MLRRKVQENVIIKDIFDRLEIEDREHANLYPEFDIRVKTPYGYKLIKEFFRTENQNSVTCYFGNNSTVKCSLNHRFKASGEWKYVKDLTKDDVIETETGYTYLKKIHKGKKEILYDISVDEVHCYYSNGILSHNSWALINIGAHCLKQGLRVAHYTLELNEAYVGLRYDAVVTGISNQNLKYNIEDVKDRVSKLAGELIIKYYPTKTASVLTIKAHIDKLILQNRKPDIVIVDYADLLRNVNSRKEVRHDLENIYEDLRGLAGEYNLPCFSASQAGRAALNDEIIEAGRISESYAKIMIADFVISLQRKVTDKLAGTGRWHIIKNRFGPDGLTYPSKLNMSNGQIHIYEEQSNQGKETKKEMENGSELVRKSLAQKYQEMNNFG